MKDQNQLLLDNQLCFSLYRLSKLITGSYRNLLEQIDLTYPQYLVMLVLWEEEKVNMSSLGKKLSLDNGTLTPLIKRLIDKGLLEKKRCHEDERVVFITLTQVGKNLRAKALSIPNEVACSSNLDIEKITKIKKELDELFNQISGDKNE